MKLINDETVLLQEIVKKTKEETIEIVGEAEVVLSNRTELKKGDRVIINRNGILPVKRGKKNYVLLHIEDVLIKL